MVAAAHPFAAGNLGPDGSPDAAGVPSALEELEPSVPCAAAPERQACLKFPLRAVVECLWEATVSRIAWIPLRQWLLNTMAAGRVRVRTQGLAPVSGVTTSPELHV